MATNNFGPGTTQGDALRRVAYTEKTWREQLAKLILFSNFASLPSIDNVKGGKASYIQEEGGAIVGVQNKSGEAIRIVQEFAAMRGDRIQFPSIAPLVGAGITGTSGKRVIDNTEAISTSVMTMDLEEYAHGIKDTSPLGRKRTQMNTYEESIDLLVTWSVEKLEKLAMAALFSSPTVIVYPGSITADSGITASDTITLDLLRVGKTIATTRGTTLRNIVKPIKTSMGDRLIAVMDPETMHTLKTSSEYKQLAQTAMVRGKENEMFSGAEFITVDGIACYSSEYVPLGNFGAGSAVPGSRIKLFGQNALLMGFGQNPVIEEEDGDFKREKAVGIKFMFSVKKPVFNGKDWGSVEIRAARNVLTAY